MKDFRFSFLFETQQQSIEPYKKEIVPKLKCSETKDRKKEPQKKFRYEILSASM